MPSCQVCHDQATVDVAPGSTHGTRNMGKSSAQRSAMPEHAIHSGIGIAAPAIGCLPVPRAVPKMPTSAHTRYEDIQHTSSPRARCGPGVPGCYPSCKLSYAYMLAMNTVFRTFSASPARSRDVAPLHCMQDTSMTASLIQEPCWSSNGGLGNVPCMGQMWYHPI